LIHFYKRQDGGVSGPRAVLHSTVGSGRRDSALRHPSQPAQKRYSGDASVDRRVLLAFLALLLHVADEPSDRSHAGQQGPLRHETRVGLVRHASRSILSIMFHMPALLHLQSA